MTPWWGKRQTATGALGSKPHSPKLLGHITGQESKNSHMQVPLDDTDRLGTSFEDFVSVLGCAALVCLFHVFCWAAAVSKLSGPATGTPKPSQRTLVIIHQIDPFLLHGLSAEKQEKTSIWMLFQLVRHICHTLSNHCRNSFLSTWSLCVLEGTFLAMSLQDSLYQRQPKHRGCWKFQAHSMMCQWVSSETKSVKWHHCVYFLIIPSFLFFFFENDFSKWFNWVITHHKSCPRINRTQCPGWPNFCGSFAKRYLGI